VVLRCVVLSCALALLVAAPAPAPAAPALLHDDFSGADGLITNERVIDDHNSPAPVSPTWIVTSGSLLRRGGWGWTGVPDATSPDVCSCLTTGSAVFRMISRRADLGDVAVAMRVRTRRPSIHSTSATPSATFVAVARTRCARPTRSGPTVVSASVTYVPPLDGPPGDLRLIVAWPSRRWTDT
jgi:hypothetical protein